MGFDSSYRQIKPNRPNRFLSGIILSILLFPAFILNAVLSDPAELYSKLTEETSKLSDSVLLSASQTLASSATAGFEMLRTNETLMIFLFLGFLLVVILLLRRYEIGRIKIKNQLEIERVELESLRKLNELRSEFFTNLSHEFRTPLTLICGNTESLLSADIPYEERKRIESVRRSAGQLLTLVNQLLDLSMLEEGKMQLQSTRFNLVAYARAVFQCFLPQAEVRGVKMVFASEDDSISVEMDRDKMGKMLNNLLSNALKYTSIGGLVRLVITALDHRVAEVRVEDNGLGIPDNELTAIFNRFYRSGNPPGRKADGSGIGLAHTRELAGLHKGSINAYSKNGEYTAFVLRLPVITSEPVPELNGDTMIYGPDSYNPEPPYCGESAETTDANAGIYHPENGELILIVEDNNDVRQFTRQQLEKDFRIAEACNGEEGLEAAKKYVPDLIISDVMMPVMDGLRFGREIRSHPATSHIPLILLTAKARMEDRIEGLENGIDDYITKPFSVKELRARIRNLLDTRKLLREHYERSGFSVPDDAPGIPADKAFLEKTFSIVHQHLEDSGFKVETLASELSLSVSQLNRKLNALINLPAGELMRTCKLKRAAELLKNKSGTVSEICYTLGFSDQAYFARSFRKYFGCTPTEYMKSCEPEFHRNGKS
jgi:signal transduction histidine kinase/AraC-like DNA-binding protein